MRVYLFAVVNTGSFSLFAGTVLYKFDPHAFKTYPSCLGDNRLFNVLDLHHFDRVYSYLYAPALGLLAS
jgi:hypothetical protein